MMTTTTRWTDPVDQTRDPLGPLVLGVICTRSGAAPAAMEIGK